MQGGGWLHPSLKKWRTYYVQIAHWAARGGQWARAAASWWHLAFPKRAPHPVPRVQGPSIQTAPWPPGHPCGFGPWLEVQTLMGASLARWNVGEPRLGCGSEAFSPAGAGGLGRGRPTGSWEGRVPSSLCCLAAVSWDTAAGCRAVMPGSQRLWLSFLSHGSSAGSGWAWGVPLPKAPQAQARGKATLLRI